MIEQYIRDPNEQRYLSTNPKVKILNNRNLPFFRIALRVLILEGVYFKGSTLELFGYSSLVGFLFITRCLALNDTGPWGGLG